MKKTSNYYKWIVAFVFSVAVIAVYKTFDNIVSIGQAIKDILSAFAPFFGGFVIAYLLNLPSKKLTGLLSKIKVNFVKKHAYGISILVIYLITFVLIGVALGTLLPALYRNFIDLSLNLPGYANSVIDWLRNLDIVKRFDLLELESFDISGTINSLLNLVDPKALEKFAKGVFSVTSGVVSVFLAFISSVYMLLDKENIIESMVRFVNIIFTKEKADSICRHARRINSIFTSYIYCRMVCSIIMAFACTIVLSLMDVKYAVILGIFIGSMDMIPYFGSIISVVIAEIVILITGGPWQMLWTSIILLIMQQFDGNLLAPKIMGMSLDIRPLWIVIVVTVGGSFFGFLGMLLSVPVFATVRAIVLEYFEEYKLKKANRIRDKKVDET